MGYMTVDEIQKSVAAVSDQDQVSGDLSSQDYSLRLQYMNMAQREWAETYDWQALYKEYNTLTSTSTGNASIALPLNFRKLASYPMIVDDGITARAYPENRPQENQLFPTLSNQVLPSNTRHVNIIGNYAVGYTMLALGVPLVSGASIFIPYYSSPSSLASPTDVPACPNPDFLTKRTIAYIMESRGDARFPQYKIEATNLLKNMLEFENVYGEASTFDRIKSVEETKYGYRIGRD